MGWIARRARQFFLAVTAPLTADDWDEAQRILTPTQCVLFLQMPLPDRRHALTVLRTLEAQGEQQSDLLVAALLHDVGKAGASASLWMRVTVALLEWFAPTLLDRLSQEGGRGWRGYLAAYCQHAEVGARQAAQVGCSPLTVALIRRHHKPVGRLEGEQDRLLALLQEADGSF
jgi:hypothetical protein